MLSVGAGGEGESWGEKFGPGSGSGSGEPGAAAEGERTARAPRNPGREEPNWLTDLRREREGEEG